MSVSGPIRGRVERRQASSHTLGVQAMANQMHSTQLYPDVNITRNVTTMRTDSPAHRTHTREHFSKSLFCQHSRFKAHRTPQNQHNQVHVLALKEEMYNSLQMNAETLKS